MSLTMTLVVVDVASTSQDFGIDTSFLHSEYSVALSEACHVKIVAFSFIDSEIVIRSNANGILLGAAPPDTQPANINATDKVIVLFLFDINIKLFTK
ncbi:hypothetical protein [Vibrio cholerae]|uniref:hypothetical protein n=1 Tax=Vibrio cholerae TaxID=666 RepID=UPI000E0AF68E|nr:hypothetical protein [Vibrio cholerae]MBO1386438.1 hypothetical protein [Vibrio cholerae]